MEGNPMSTVYVSEADNRSIAYTEDAFGGYSYVAPAPSQDIAGRATFDRDLGEWVVDQPYVPTNEEKRKFALTALSAQYREDTAKLNDAWLASAVSDGAGEDAKKASVVAQVADRMTQYIADRATIIAQYP